MATMNYLIVAVIAFTAAAAVVDYRTGHIPNRLVLGGFVLGLVCNFTTRILVAPSGLELEAAKYAAVNAVLGIIACALVPLVLYRFQAIGGGDVKLFAALGGFVGPLFGLELMFYSFVIGALFAQVRLAYQGRLMRVLANSMTLAVNPFLPKQRRRELPQEALTSIRFGPAVCAGACIVAALHWRS